MALRSPNGTALARLVIRFQDALEAANRRQIDVFTQQCVVDVHRRLIAKARAVEVLANRCAQRFWQASMRCSTHGASLASGLAPTIRGGGIDTQCVAGATYGQFGFQDQRLHGRASDNGLSSA